MTIIPVSFGIRNIIPGQIIAIGEVCPFFIYKLEKTKNGTNSLALLCNFVRIYEPEQLHCRSVFRLFAFKILNQENQTIINSKLITKQARNNEV